MDGLEAWFKVFVAAPRGSTVPHTGTTPKLREQLVRVDFSVSEAILTACEMQPELFIGFQFSSGSAPVQTALQWGNHYVVRHGLSKNKEKKNAQAAVLAYLNSTETLKLLGDLDVANIHQLSGFTQTVHQLLLEPSSLGGPQALFRYLLNITRDHPKLHSALEDVNTRISHQRNGSNTDMASHRQKCLLVHGLQLHQKPQSLKDFITGNLFDPNAPPGSLKNPLLSDTKCRPNSRDFVCDKNAGFYMCETYESVIFLGYVPSEIPEPIAHLVVLRGVFGSSSDLIAWLKSAVDHAVSGRRDVRPDAPGVMVQVGFNAGPRHARVFGLAKSHAKRVDDITKVEHDNDIIAATAVVWGVAKAWLPANITEQIDSKLLESDSGRGFRINLGSCEYSFPSVERAPPEAYLTLDYSASLHDDPCYVPGACAISVNAGHTVDPPPPASPSSSNHASSTSLHPTTRSQTSRGFNPSIADPMAEDPSLWPVSGGGNFVDMTLKVVVKQDAGTMFAFVPTFRHGTACLCGGDTITIAFSEHILDAFKKAQEGVSVEAGEGLAMEIVPRIDKDREKVLSYFLQQKQARPITVHFILH
ncbi:hypothetical protein B0H13DRAFT_2275785 [Mycena leptocephala]|nr:hypothetical protein B0H13DRAFT_2275785 [Mycena leptocephala]